MSSPSREATEASVSNRSSGPDGGNSTSSVGGEASRDEVSDAGSASANGAAFGMNSAGENSADVATPAPLLDSGIDEPSVTGIADAATRPDSSGTFASDPTAADVDAGVGWDAVPNILARIAAPTFPNLDCNITQYGGVGDGTTDNTTAFAKAIADCSSKGGGRVVVSSGTFFTGPIALASNINLYVGAGATIKFSTDPTKYLPVVKTSYEGSLLYNYRPLVSAHDATNVAITGNGTLDGNASSNDWWGWNGSKEAPDVTALRTQNVYGVLPEQRIYGSGHYLRPSLIEFLNCTNVLFDNFTAENSPFWTIHPVLSKNITAHNVHSVAPSNQGNTDGFDPESCVDVLVDGLTIQVGDDSIAIKAGRDRDGRTYYTPTENVIIQNCTFLSHTGGVTIGSEMSAGVRGVYIQDTTFSGASGGLVYGIAPRASIYRGGFIENVYGRRLTVGEVDNFFFLAGQYGNGAGPTEPVDYTMFNNFNFDTITVTRTTGSPFGIQGPAASQVAKGIHFSNITIENADAPILAGVHYADVTASDVTVNGAAWTPLESFAP